MTVAFARVLVLSGACFITAQNHLSFLYELSIKLYPLEVTFFCVAMVMQAF